MPSRRHTYRWPVQGARADRGDSAPLSIRLVSLADDRASSAAALVREACQRTGEWLLTTDDDWTWPRAFADLSAELVDFRGAHDWRGPVALWLDTLEATLALPEHLPLDAGPREVLAEELGLWLGGESGDGDAYVPWNGRPLAPGRRLAPREACVRALLADLTPREVILVHGWSETVMLALEELQARGLAPEVILSEGGPDLGGRRMARRLAARGLNVTLVYDAALTVAVLRADRVWLGTEAIGAQGFLGRVGTRALLEEARRREVPSAVLATGDKLMPMGELRLPEWSRRDRWLLWESAPEGVNVESQAFESVPLSLPDAFATECGRETVAEIAVRSLRTETHSA